MILLAAGKGNLCRGFENILDLYSEAHNQGFRPGDDLSILNIGRETTDSPNLDDHLVDKGMLEASIDEKGDILYSLTEKGKKHKL